jgi:hypothetical protein
VWNFGVRRFYEKHDIIAPERNNVQLLSKNQLEYFHDIKFAIDSVKFMQPKDNTTYFQTILQSANYKDYCKE